MTVRSVLGVSWDAASEKNIKRESAARVMEPTSQKLEVRRRVGGFMFGVSGVATA